jgi:hypothetical protein
LIGLKALWVSERVQSDATRQRDRTRAYERMMQTHTALNELEPLLKLRHELEETQYREKQQWLRTMLTTAGLRDQLPITKGLSERDIVAPEDEMIRLVQEAREELLRELDHQAASFYAGSADPIVKLTSGG